MEIETIMNLSTRAKKYLGNIGNFLLDILLPKTCKLCGKEGKFLCERCVDALPVFEYPLCPNPRCRKKLIGGRVCKNCREGTDLTRFFAALPYHDKTVREMLWEFKYLRARGLTAIFAEILIKFLKKGGFESELKRKRSILIPVPLSHSRQRHRGFNQSEEIAKYLSQYFQIPLEAEILARVKDTLPQAEIKDADERQKNIRGSFACKNPKLIEGKITIVVDDVYTSGSTMKECAKMLRAAGAWQVWGIVLILG